ncbi:FAD-dependent monooxygenase [Candidatus Halobonum tyrrellensis]|uniref:FAD-binding domain-containing protein n=1 Tax=Candidatus Halobonum tyrrellensis G22 TaxID=1324957 RepID=V4HEH7_9EURY|nr:FAD-dependent monooxygenase [Candidatus Halobonum tyrrellensis]ESP88493.1 hypothetical protein K933_08537 [Candidatus Halobonum tyrrellensis G22]
MTREELVDVAVVGCGPGGAVLSYLLARSGVDVALVEHEGSFDREFRGFGWSPGVVDLFDRMDLLGDVLDLDHETTTTGEVVLYGDRVEAFDFGTLDTPHPYALLMEQPPLLELLVERASAYDEFSFHPATTVEGLRTADGAVVGVDAHDRRVDEDVTLRSRAVVGADGRYSTVRSAAGIDAGLFDSPLELVWFKLPSGAVDARAQGHVGDEGVLLYFGLGRGEVQVGWLLEAGTYPDVRAAGIEAFRERLARVDPRLRPALDDQPTDFDDCSLLDVAPGLAPQWTRPGMLLLGDAAHVASPIGAQGNALAVGDAAVAHDVLCDALGRRGDADASSREFALPASALVAFESRRRPEVERTLALQRRAERALAGLVRDGDRLPARALTAAARVGGPLVFRLPFVGRAVDRFALGPAPGVATERFVHPRH